MKRKDLDNFKKQSIGELKTNLLSLRKEVASFRFDMSQGKVKNVHGISQKKKDVAKIMTILRLKSLSQKVNNGKEEVGSGSR